ncbi:MAG: hypothetical protein ABIQ74_11950 [Chitinophagales bacterium]
MVTIISQFLITLSLSFNQPGHAKLQGFGSSGEQLVPSGVVIIDTDEL